MTEKIKNRKPTVEQTLRAEILSLKEAADYGNKKYKELYQDGQDAKQLAKTLYRVMKNANSKSNGNSIEFTVGNSSSYREESFEEKAGTLDLLNAIIVGVTHLASEFAKEDEATSIAYEHKEDLMDLLRIAMNDNTRINKNSERAVVVNHNLKIAEKRDQIVAINGDDMLFSNANEHRYGDR